MKNYKNINDKKNYNIYKIINIENKKFNTNLNEKVIKRKCNNVASLSTNEIVLKNQKENISIKQCIKILKKFLDTPVDDNFIYKRNLFEILKISFFYKEKINLIFNLDNYLLLNDKLKNVSHETCYFSVDFIILTIIDNIISKCDNIDVIKIYKENKKNILNNLCIKNFIEEDKNREYIYVSWINRLSKELLIDEISPNQFINICKKIITTVDCYEYFYENLYSILEYLIKNNIKNSNIIDYKNTIKDIIINKKIYTNIDVKKLENIAIYTLSNDVEDIKSYENLFYVIKNINLANHEIMEYVISLCGYILFYDKKYNIFYNKDIRRLYIETILFISNKNNFTDLNVDILILLIKILHTDYFFTFNKNDLIKSIVDVLIKQNKSEIKLTMNNYYKFCDVLDYFIFNNYKTTNFEYINKLILNSSNIKKIFDRFQLTHSIINKLLNTPLLTNTKTSKDIIQNFINLYNTCYLTNRATS